MFAKVDTERAYNKPKWDNLFSISNILIFIFYSLNGFSLAWMVRVLKYSSMAFNDSWFHSSAGLRRECPPSPFSFCTLFRFVIQNV